MFRPVLLAAALLAPLPAAALNVVTDIPPVQSLAAEVMGDTGTPARLLRPGTSPHDLALRPSDAEALQTADAVFWIGPALSPMLEKAMTTLAGKARVVALLDAPQTLRLPLREGVALTADEHDAGVTDPHAWLDPANGIAWLGIIARTLAELDPANADIYRANAAKAAARLGDVRKAAAGQFGDARPSYALYHDELQYFEHAFGVAGVTALSDGEAHTPGARRRAEVLSLLAAKRPACILAGPETAPRALVPLTEAAGARPVTIDILTGGQKEGPDLYPGLFTALAGALSACHR